MNRTFESSVSITKSLRDRNVEFGDQFEAAQSLLKQVDLIFPNREKFLLEWWLDRASSDKSDVLIDPEAWHTLLVIVKSFSSERSLESSLRHRDLVKIIASTCKTALSNDVSTDLIKQISDLLQILDSTFNFGFRKIDPDLAFTFVGSLFALAETSSYQFSESQLSALLSIYYKFLLMLSLPQEQRSFFFSEKVLPFVLLYQQRYALWNEHSLNELISQGLFSDLPDKFNPEKVQKWVELSIRSVNDKKTQNAIYQTLPRLFSILSSHKVLRERPDYSEIAAHMLKYLYYSSPLHALNIFCCASEANIKISSQICSDIVREVLNGEEYPIQIVRHLLAVCGNLVFPLEKELIKFLSSCIVDDPLFMANLLTQILELYTQNRRFEDYICFLLNFLESGIPIKITINDTLLCEISRSCALYCSAQFLTKYFEESHQLSKTTDGIFYISIALINGIADSIFDREFVQEVYESELKNCLVGVSESESRWTYLFTLLCLSDYSVIENVGIADLSLFFSKQECCSSIYLCMSAFRLAELHQSFYELDVSSWFKRFLKSKDTMSAYVHGWIKKPSTLKVSDFATIFVLRRFPEIFDQLLSSSALKVLLEKLLTEDGLSTDYFNEVTDYLYETRVLEGALIFSKMAVCYRPSEASTFPVARFSKLLTCLDFRTFEVKHVSSLLEYLINYPIHGINQKELNLLWNAIDFLTAHDLKNNFGKSAFIMNLQPKFEDQDDDFIVAKLRKLFSSLIGSVPNSKLATRIYKEITNGLNTCREEMHDATAVCANGKTQVFIWLTCAALFQHLLDIQQPEALNTEKLNKLLECTRKTNKLFMDRMYKTEYEYEYLIPCFSKLVISFDLLEGHAKTQSKEKYCDFFADYLTHCLSHHPHRGSAFTKCYTEAFQAYTHFINNRSTNEVLAVYIKMRRDFLTSKADYTLGRYFEKLSDIQFNCITEHIKRLLDFTSERPPELITVIRLVNILTTHGLSIRDTPEAYDSSGIIFLACLVVLSYVISEKQIDANVVIIMLNTVRLILAKKMSNILIRQSTFEIVVSICSSLFSASGPEYLLSDDYAEAESLYISCCQTLSDFLSFARFRFQGRHSILVNAVNTLMEALYDIPNTKIGSCQRAKWTLDQRAKCRMGDVNCAFAFGRLISILVSPLTAQVQKQSNSLAVSSVTERKALVPFVALILTRYVQLSLNFKVPLLLRPSIQNTVFEMLDTQNPESLATITSRISVTGASLFRNIYKEYIAHGKWNDNLSY
ncbi:hypothetical protein CANCADRAFT_87364 [Tortispora caseinolytica NRRL Y-17796]|uniref:Nucleolar 27S pre-rRNA processing Urb2/Npa2 C-terminal domain-containing protein n=1 Tax=Tortispora caseinolytica NRRL Y-17796 TaxID=767744 RepID=A0A1E4TL57_9ASCO|nr:hypothetical protein CANCADRAFT_87364 [Tortispora caseinolytica NRRL Y-17796]